MADFFPMSSGFETGRLMMLTEEIDGIFHIFVGIGLG